jgi:DNA-binding NtrC family response regulator
MADINNQLEIVLVEDDEPTRIAYQRLLEQQGYKVAAFQSSGSALDLVRTGVGNLVITDIRLGDGQPHGMKLALMIRNFHPWLPIIFMTAYPDLKGFVDGDLGPVLIKPIDTDELLAAVKTALDLP